MSFHDEIMRIWAFGSERRFFFQPLRGRTLFIERAMALHDVLLNRGSAQIVFDTEAEAKDFSDLAKRMLEKLGL